MFKTIYKPNITVKFNMHKCVLNLVKLVVIDHYLRYCKNLETLSNYQRIKENNTNMLTACVTLVK